MQKKLAQPRKERDSRTAMPREEVFARYLHIPEMAVLLDRSEGAVRQLVWRRQIPYRRVAGRVVFLRDEIELFIREQSDGVRPEEIKVGA